MFRRFIFLEIKNFLRSKSFGAGLAMKIGMFFIFAYIAAIYFGGAFLLYFGAKEEDLDPLKLFSGYFLIYWLLDLLMKYFFQQLPTENIKPLLTLRITKSQIAGYTLVKILFSFFSWSFLLFMIPFAVLLLSDPAYSNSGVIAVFVTAVAMIFSNTFINTVINKKDWLMYTVFGIMGVAGALHYFNIIDLVAVSEQVVYSVYQTPLLALIPVTVMALLAYFTFRFIRENLYLDKGLEMKKSVGKTENIAFLNRYGTLGIFINNDIKLIRRSKAARSAFIGGFLFLFYGLLFFSNGYDNSFMMVFMGIFVTGGFNMMFGQRVPAWDSSYYPLMMTQNVPYKDYLKAKWAIFVFGIAVSMILAIAYAFISWEFYFAIFAAGLYNLGVNSYLTLLAGAYNKKPIDLNSASKGFSGGQNNFNFKTLLLIIPQMILPAAIFGIVNYFVGLFPAVLTLGILGIIGFLFRDKIFDRIVKIYKTEKYTTLAAFKEI